MYKNSIRKMAALTLSLATLTSFGFVNVASAVAQSSSSGHVSSAHSDVTTAHVETEAADDHGVDASKAKLIISRGDKEISRRLITLNSLKSKISSATKLSSSDKSSLSGEVDSEISGLTSLKSTLDAETTSAAAKTDAQSVFNDYRVYALIVPKVLLVKTADDQQVAEAKLSTLATKLQTRVTGTNAQLSDMVAQISAAQALSSSVESKVLTLQPSDYNSDHTVLSSYRGQLQTAQNQLKTAAADAKTVIASLKS